MLPALTTRAARISRRTLLGVAGVALSLAAGAFELSAAPSSPPAAAPSIAERLPARSWGFTLPTSWLAAPLVGIRPGDRIDVLSLRPGGAAAAAIAFDLEVVTVDERYIVLGVGAEDATALAVARASGQLIVPLVRSTR